MECFWYFEESMLFKFFVLDDKRRYLFNSDYNDDD